MTVFINKVGATNVNTTLKTEKTLIGTPLAASRPRPTLRTTNRRRPLITVLPLSNESD